MTAARYELLRGRGAHELIAIGEHGERTVADLCADVSRVAACLPEPAQAEVEQALIVCVDRYLFGVALLASWARGYTAALPPSHHEQALRELSARVAVVVHDGEAASGIDVRAVLARPSEQGGLGARSGSLPIGGLDAAAPAVTLYTSGTTGEPHAVGKSAEQLLGEVEVLTASFGAGICRVLCTLPPRHIYGLLFGLLLPMRAGGAFTRETLLHADAVLAHVERHRIDTMVAVPAHLQGLTAFEPSRLGTLTRVFTSGAPLRAEVFADLTERLGLRVTEVFGSTETGGIAHRARAGAPYVPFGGVEVSAADDGRMLLSSARLPAGAPRPMVCEDVIELRADGSFEHLGRADDIVKVGGSRVALSAVERAVRSLSNVRDAAVIARGLPSARGHEVLAVIAAEGWDASSMRSALLERLESIAVPRRYRFVAELPREPTGKLRRDTLLALFAAPSRPPRLEVERSSMTHGATEARVELRVPADLLCFQGHFEGWPVLPAVAQLGWIAVRHVEAIWPALGPLRRVRRLKMKQPIAPDELLVLELTRKPPSDGASEGLERVDFSITRDGQLCTMGSLAFAAERGP